MGEITPAQIKRSKFLYILEATFEYLIALLVSGSFLATLTKELGISDNITGILSSFISLGCLFELFSIGLKKNNVKRIVVLLSIVNQILFMMLYVTPVFNISGRLKTILFVLLIIFAYIIYYFIHPKKINWLMSLVEDEKRGIFTANKEIVSLVAGIIFSFLMGMLIDHFMLIGNIWLGLILSAITIFILMISHTACMCFINEMPSNLESNKSIWMDFADVFKNKKLSYVIILFVVYYIAKDISFPFYGTYKINELGFSLTYSSAMVICGNITRILSSKALGRYADKKSFAYMIEKCFIFLAIGDIFIIFSNSANGKIMFIFYEIFYGISMGGINSAFTNMIFDYVPYEKRSNSLAICQALSGLVGFLATLLVSPLLSKIQATNTVFGIQMYAQQFLTAISFIFTVILILFVRIKMINSNKKES